jgi:hypothetical protein
MSDCKVLGCDKPPRREIGGRVLVCDEHAAEYEEHAECDWR